MTTKPTPAPTRITTRRDPEANARLRALLLPQPTDTAQQGVTSKHPPLYLGSVTTGSGRPITSPEAQLALARALLGSVPTNTAQQGVRQAKKTA